MTVGHLKSILAKCDIAAEVLVRLDDEYLENPNGNIVAIVGADYSYGCTETLALMLDCGQAGEEPVE